MDKTYHPDDMELLDIAAKEFCQWRTVRYFTILKNCLYRK